VRTLLALIAVALPLSAAAHDLPHVAVPDDTVVVLRPLLPQFGTQAGEGRVRLVYHSPDLAARMGVNDFHAYELAYKRRLTRLMFRHPMATADPIARHGAWHDVMGTHGDPAFSTGELASD